MEERGWRVSAGKVWGDASDLRHVVQQDECREEYRLAQRMLLQKQYSGVYAVMAFVGTP